MWGKGIAEKTESYSGSEKTKYYIRKAGQLMYGKLDFLHQAFGIVPNRLDGYQSTLDSPAFDISSEINSNFLLSEISRKEFYERLGKIANGSRKAKRIHVDTFFDMPMVIPKIKEQNQISRIIETTNSAITLHEEKLEQLKALKRGMLQDLFPDQGETTPVLRHEGFKSGWISRKLGDISEIITGGDKDDSILKEKGNYPVIANAVNTDGVIGYYDDQYRIKAPALTVTGRGDVGHATARFTNFTPVVRLLALTTDENVVFLTNAINNIQIRDLLVRNI